MTGTWLSRLLCPRQDDIAAVQEAATRAVSRFQKVYGYADRDDRKESLVASFLAFRRIEGMPLARSVAAQVEVMNRIFEDLARENPESVASFGTMAAWFREEMKGKET